MLGLIHRVLVFNATIYIKVAFMTITVTYYFCLNQVGATGLEPATPTTPKWCATGLRYAPNHATVFTNLIFFLFIFTY